MARALKLILAIIFMGVMALTKGFGALVALPLLIFVVMPAVASSQATTDQRLADGTAHPSMALLANIQLACACVFYFVMPMAGDGSPVIIYIVSGSEAEILFPILTAASAVGFVLSGVKFLDASRTSTPLPPR